MARAIAPPPCWRSEGEQFVFDMLAAKPLFSHERRKPFPADDRCQISGCGAHATLTYDREYVSPKSGELAVSRDRICWPHYLRRKEASLAAN